MFLSAWAHMDILGVCVLLPYAEPSVGAYTLIPAKS